MEGRFHTYAYSISADMAHRLPEQEEEQNQLVEGVANLGLNGIKEVVSFHSFLEASCMINLATKMFSGTRSRMWPIKIIY